CKGLGGAWRSLPDAGPLERVHVTKAGLARRDALRGEWDPDPRQTDDVVDGLARLGEALVSKGGRDWLHRYKRSLPTSWSRSRLSRTSRSTSSRKRIVRRS